MEAGSAFGGVCVPGRVALVGNVSAVRHRSDVACGGGISHPS